MEILGYLLLGLIVGPLARLLVPGRDPMGIAQTVIIGGLGSLLGGLVFQQWITPNNNGIPWIAAILGAVVLVVIVRLMRRSRTA
jgi:uncharacterized membrane protein YeaQ/YmgE (transglycosylase-associated protein family)